MTVTANDGSDDGTPTTNAVGIDNHAPVVTTAVITGSNPKTNETLNVTATGTDPDGGTPTLTYQWTKNGTDISGATGTTLDLAVAGHGDRGDEIGVKVKAYDGALYSEVFLATAVTVIDTAPSANVSLAPDPVGSDGTLTATADTADDDNDAVTVTYVWKVGSTVRKTTPNSSSLTDTFDLSLVGNGDPGDTITVEVTPSDGTLDGSPVSDSATVQATALDFDGVDDHVDLGEATALDAQQFTLEPWFRRTGAGVGQHRHGRHRQRDPARHQGPRRGRDPANVNMDCFLGIDAADGVLVADFEDTPTAPTTRSPARPRSRRTSGTTPR